MSNVATATPVIAYATATAPPVARTTCQIMGISPLSTQAFAVELQAPAGTPLAYHAGQYLALELDIHGDGQQQSLCYSIANGFNPEQPRRLQLFIHNSSERVAKVLKHLSQLSESNATINVTLPMGQAFLQTDLSAPHILIAAGSGISQIKCLAEAIIRHQPHAHVHIYWSNKKADDFYPIDTFQEGLDQHQNIHFTPIIESADTSWAGRSGYIYQIITDDFAELSRAQVYLCGSPQMVYGTIDKLKPIGLKQAHCYSDVFEYAPRC